MWACEPGSHQGTCCVHTCHTAAQPLLLDRVAWEGRSPEEVCTPYDRSTPFRQPLGSPMASTKPVEILHPKALLVQRDLLPVPRETHPWAFLSVFPKAGHSCVLSHKTVNWGLGLTSCHVSHRQERGFTSGNSGPGSSTSKFDLPLWFYWSPWKPHTPSCLSSEPSRN